MRIKKDTQLKLKPDGTLTDAMTDIGDGTPFTLEELAREQVEASNKNASHQHEVFHTAILRCTPNTIVLSISEIPRKRHTDPGSLNKRKVFHYHYGSAAALIKGGLDVDVEGVTESLNAHLLPTTDLKPFNGYANARFYSQKNHEIVLTKPMHENGDCVAYTPLESFYTSTDELGDRLFTHDVKNSTPHKVSGHETDTLVMIAKRFHNKEAWYFPDPATTLKHFGLRPV
jgi:hypothetical protein